MICGAIDLGGTKIEARLFDPELKTLDVRRIPTPTADFDSFMDGLAEQTLWMLNRSGDFSLPIGIGIPGLVDPRTGLCFASNVPISGRNVRATLAARMGRDFVFGHDCMSFAYSEAHGGAGTGADTVVGLIMGTGLAAGLCIGGRLPERHNGMAVEIGHVGVPARVLGDLGLPLFPCGCGKNGCFERYVSGTGIAEIAGHILGERRAAPALAAEAAGGHAGAEHVLNVWARLAAECLLTLQFILDPDCVVLGGGLSRMEGILQRVGRALDGQRLGHTRPPDLRLATHGDSSGARGMALLALHGAKA